MNRLFQSLGYKKRYHTENPFDWMELISLEGADAITISTTSTAANAIGGVLL